MGWSVAAGLGLGCLVPGQKTCVPLPVDGSISSMISKSGKPLFLKCAACLFIYVIARIRVTLMRCDNNLP